MSAAGGRWRARGVQLPPLSEREARQRLRPYGQGVQAVSAAPPTRSLTSSVPELWQAMGTRGEQEFEGASERSD